MEWRPRPELNWCTRFCRPLRNHSATWPHGGELIYALSGIGNQRPRSGPFAAAVIALGFWLGRKLGQHALHLTISGQHSLKTGVQRRGDVRPLFEGGEQHRRSLDRGQAVAARL